MIKINLRQTHSCSMWIIAGFKLLFMSFNPQILRIIAEDMTAVSWWQL